MKNLAIGLLLALTVAPLSGCVPVVATGVGAGLMIADDRRSTATYLLDEEIEFKLAARIREQFGQNTRANVTSFNRRVVITGQAPDEDTRSRVEALVRAGEQVREVFNEMSIGPTNSLATRSSDALVSTRVKARFLDDKRFGANHVKVVTDSGTVFLMGLVRREEGAAAAEVAARTSGVNKVVKIFEYLD